MMDHGRVNPASPLSWLRRLMRLRWPVRVRIDHRKTLRTQVGIIREYFDRDVQVATGGSEDDADVEFLYRPGVVLVAADDAGRVEEFLVSSGRYDGSGEAVDAELDGLVRYHLPPLAGEAEANVLATLDHMDEELGNGVATPDHVLYVVPKVGAMCPATEPELPATSRPLPPLNPNGEAGRDVRVSVIDTGWHPPAAKDSDSPWLASGVDGDVEPIDLNDIQSYGGHGTFVAGVLRCIAPGSSIRVEGVLKKAGAVYESDIAHELNDAMSQAIRNRQHDPQLISVSAGTHSRKNLPLKAFEILAALQTLTEPHAQVLVVAAAGNDSSSDEFWPAAFDWVLSVGSLDATGRVSTFSNYGRWVDVWAHGEKLVNAFPNGRYVCKEEEHKNEVRNFTGLAQWSGTSFATPIVTGAIAAYMSAHPGMSAWQAMHDLIGTAKIETDPQLGPLKALGPPFVP